MSILPKTGPEANPIIVAPANRANTAALDPSGVTSDRYALIVAVKVDRPPRRPSSTGPISNDLYPPGAKYGNVATSIKAISLKLSVTDSRIVDGHT